MNILTVIPIAKGIPRDELSYFSAKEVPIGTLVTGPFGKRSIDGVVVDSYPVRDMKSIIKNQSFVLKNITAIHTNALLPQSIFLAAQKTAHAFGLKVGPVIETMIPHSTFEHLITNTQQPSQIDASEKKSSIHIQSERSNHLHRTSLQVPLEERITSYKTLIRENLAKQKSTLIIIPSSSHAEMLAPLLNIGINNSFKLLHGKKTKKYLAETTRTILTDIEPLVVLATAPFASLIRSDWDTCIIESSSSPAYRYQFNHLAFDMKYFIEVFAQKNFERIIFADTLLDVTIHARIEEKTITELRTTWHITRPEKIDIIPMKSASPDPFESKKTFSLLHSAVHERIQTAFHHQETVLLITARKGLAPLTVCGDCGTVVTCPSCHNPLVLHRTKRATSEHAEARIFMCHQCNTTTIPIDRCMNCSSWKLNPLGISTEGIYDEVIKTIPKEKVFVLDGDTATPASLKKTLALWNESKGILIATPMVLPSITSVDVGCVVSFDTLLSLPHYTAQEQTLLMTLQFLERVKHHAMIQTRIPEHEVIQSLVKDDIYGFVRNEQALRKAFHYPPFATLITLSSQVTSHQVRECSEYLQNLFHDYDPDILVKKSKTPESFVVTALMKINPKLWDDPHTPIHDIVRNLDSSFTCEINPERIV